MVSHSTASPSGSATSPRRCRSMASRFRADCRRGVTTPFFSRTGAGDPPVPRARPERADPRTAGGRRLSRAEPRARACAPLSQSRASSSSCRCWPELGFDGLVTEAGYPGSEMVPAPSALAVALGLETARQGATQPHRRLQLPTRPSACSPASTSSPRSRSRPPTPTGPAATSNSACCRGGSRPWPR